MIHLERHAYTPWGVLGWLDVYGNRVATMERPWLDNRRNESCVPEGEYLAQVQWSPKFKRYLLSLVNGQDTLAGRTYIRFHGGTLLRHTQGCVLLGTRHDIGNHHLVLCNHKQGEARLMAYLEAVGIGPGDFVRITIGKAADLGRLAPGTASQD